MPEKNNISGLMLKNHRKIEKLFAVFSNSLKDSPKSENQTFNKFQAEAQRHFGVEEETIFKYCRALKGGVFATIPKLITEHDTILEILNDIKNKLVDKRSISLGKIKKLLIRHKYCEDRFLYPQLDQCLNKNQKNSILKKLKRHI
jgi:hemerythrin superfamily protein